MDTALRLSRHQGAQYIELTRPEKRNALTVAMYAGMADAMGEAEADDAVSSIVFSGEGPAFCGGNDLADFLAERGDDADKPVFRFIRALANASKVLIAAVQGRAIGIGTTMLLHCDFVLAEPDAEFQMPFVDLGLVPEAGSSLMVPQLMGQRRAAELLLLSERVSATRAVELGLVSRVVPAGTARAEAAALAARLAQKPAGALRATKRLMRSATRDLQARIEQENTALEAQLQSEECKQAIGAFFQNRPKAAA